MATTDVPVMEGSPSTAPDQRISQPEVCRLLGNITSMTLWRWRHNKEFKFPKPVVEINGRNYYLLTEVLNWRPPNKSSSEPQPRRKAPARRNA
jgi:predicted DNA-binding transcriptional regulator AlpA